MVTARKAQDRERTLVLSTAIAALDNRRLELGRPLADGDVTEVLRKAIKQREDAAAQFRQGGRADLVGREEGQIRVLAEFLPPAVDPEELRAAVRAAIAGGATDLGKVMGRVLPAFKGRADGRLVNQIAREELEAG
jgi:uncharacterized protein YqeY